MHRFPAWSSRRAAAVALFGLLAAGCGTIVGNPKKPQGPQAPTPSTIAYDLPDLDFDVPAALSAPDAAFALSGGAAAGLTVDGGAGLIDAGAALALADQAVGAGDRTLLTSWGQRVKRIMTEIRRFRGSINAIAKAARAGGDTGDVIVFKNRGADGKVSGRLSPLPPGGPYAYEATICNDGRLVTDFLWSEDGKSIDVTRDFSQAPDGGSDPFTLLTHVVVQKGADLQLTLESQGQPAEDAALPGRAGNILTEKAAVTRLASQELQLKFVANRAAAPAADGQFVGDSFTVGHLVPSGVDAANAPIFSTEFIGYYKGYKVICKNGFDENAADLWHPAFDGSPRFCEGRPATGKVFTTYAQFYATLANLQPIGLLKQEELRSVAFKAGASCD